MNYSLLQICNKSQQLRTCSAKLEMQPHKAQFAVSSLHTRLSIDHLLSFLCTDLYQKGKRKEKQWYRVYSPPFLQPFALRGFSRIYIIQ